MTRLRRIPTSITSAAHLVAALEAGGFKVVERYGSPQPLLSWRKQPLGAEAEIIVRRDQIGSTADDLGFMRGADGSFEALVSDIHLSRFDRRWFEKLRERAAVVAPSVGALTSAPARAPQAPARAAQPASRPERPQYASTPRQPSPPEPPPPAPAQRPVAAAVEAMLAELEPSAARAPGAPSSGIDVEHELADVLRAARKASGAMGCVPWVIGWALVTVTSLASNNPRLAFFATAIAVVFFLRGAKRRTERMAAAGAAAFAARFRGNPQLREHALRKLRGGLAKHTADFRPVVEEMLRRLAG